MPADRRDDDDLAVPVFGIARLGFEKLLAAICEGRVGAVVSIEACTPSATAKYWHTSVEFVGWFGTPIVDEDEDPRHPNDRLLLGMKGNDERDGAGPLQPAARLKPEAEGAAR